VADDTVVVAFPIRILHTRRKKHDVPLWEKVDLAAQLQRYWSDNQVSITAELDPDREADQLPRILSAYEDRLKALTFLPAAKHGYEQAPYEEITGERYRELTAGLRPIVGTVDHVHELEARFCESALCEVELIDSKEG
jgi:hypothetical protein